MFNFFSLFQITWEFFSIIECWVWPSPVCSLTWILYSHLDFLLLVKSIIKPCCVRITYLAWWTERERERASFAINVVGLINFILLNSIYLQSTLSWINTYNQQLQTTIFRFPMLTCIFCTNFHTSLLCLNHIIYFDYLIAIPPLVANHSSS